MTMYADELFWDGRATSEFVDPQTGEVLIASGGALESQAVGPVVSSVEMSHESRDWDFIIDKLTSARPLALASNLTPDMAAAVDGGQDYPELFAQAFGDDQITAGRIGMAIATYERTLVPDQTPWDAVNDGDQNAMTLEQRAGFNSFTNSRCSACHVGPQFTGNGFRNIGLRPIGEDRGRFEITGNNPDRGRFKFMQWIVADTQAPNGLAASPVAQLTYFCSMNGTCINSCPADLTNDGELNFFDVSAFLSAFASSDPAADFTGDGQFNFFDVSAFPVAFSAGCP
ncbi:MAG: hypothetical protein JKX70_05765 [Phycisphaerales bacterium]|nr:hypothetical protein [Phycisphaerales bacterium]